MAQDNLQSQGDQELQFKKRARRRLVGAIALVLLMIVVLPMVLEDRTAQTPKVDVVVSIPSQDQQASDNKDPVQNPVKIAPVEAAPIQKMESAPASEATVNGGGFDPQSELQSAELKSSEAKAVVNVDSLEPAAAKSEAPQKVAADSKINQAKIDDKSTAANQTYYIQIGVYSDPDNVKQMQAKLTEKGLKSSSELIDTAKGKKTRLRVVSFKSKKEAEAALAKVQSISLNGVIGAN